MASATNNYYPDPRENNQDQITNEQRNDQRNGNKNPIKRTFNQIDNRSEQRKFDRQEIMSARWAQYIGQDKPVRIYMKRNALFTMSLTYGNKGSFSVMLSRKDPFLPEFLRRFGKHCVLPQGLMDRLFTINHVHKIESSTADTVKLASHLVQFTACLFQISRAKTWSEVGLCILASNLTFVEATSTFLLSAISKIANTKLAQSSSSIAPTAIALLMSALTMGTPAVKVLTDKYTAGKLVLPTVAATYGCVRLVKYLWDDFFPHVYKAVYGMDLVTAGMIDVTAEFGILEREVLQYDKPETVNEIKSNTKYQDLAVGFFQRLTAMVEQYPSSKLPHITGKRFEKVKKLVESWYAIVTGEYTSVSVTRLPPLCVRLHGEPGVGKSLVSSTLAAGIMKGKYVLPDSRPFESLIYHRPGNAEYWQGYANQPIIVYDDWGQRADSAGKPNPDFGETIDLVSTQLFRPPMASTHEKRNTICKPSLVMLCTNMHNVVVKSIIKPEALTRRFFLDVEVMNKRKQPLDREMVDQYGIDFNHYVFHAKVNDPKGALIKEYHDINIKKLIEIAREHYDYIRKEPKVTSLVDDLFRGKTAFETIDEKTTPVQADAQSMFHRPGGYHHFVVVKKPPEEGAGNYSGLLIGPQILKDNEWDYALHQTMIDSGYIKDGALAVSLLGDLYFEEEPTPDQIVASNRLWELMNKRYGHLDFDELPSGFLEPSLQRLLTILHQADPNFDCTMKMEQILNYHEADLYEALEAKGEFYPPSLMAPFRTMKTFLRNLWDKFKDMCVGIGENIAHYTRVFVSLMKQRLGIEAVPQGEDIAWKDIFGASLIGAATGIGVLTLFYALMYGFAKLYDLIWPTEAQPEGALDVEAEQLAQKIAAKNMMTIKKKDVQSDDIIIGHVLFVRNRVGITPNHVARAVFEGRERGEEFFYSTSTSSGTLTDIKVYHIGNDLAHVEFSPTDFPSEFPNIVNRFMQTTDPQSLSNDIILVNQSERRYGRGRHHGMRLHYTATYPTSQESIRLKTSIEYDINTVNGNCGSVVISQNPSCKRKIIGIHVAGSAGKGFGRWVCQEELLPVSESYSQKQPVYTKVTTQGGKPNVEYIRDAQPVYQSTKSKLRHSDLYGTFESKARPALLKDKGEISPYQLAVERYNVPRGDWDFSSIQCYLDYYVLRPFKEYHSYQRVFTIYESVAGVNLEDPANRQRGTKLLPIPRNNSAGYPWVLMGKGMNKTHWLGKGDIRFIREDLQTAVGTLIKRALADSDERPIFIDTLKDERRSFKKTSYDDPENIKTRLFSASPMDFTIMARMYLGAFVLSLRANKISNGFTAGIDPHSMDWTQIVNHLQENGDLAFDGDWSSFDSTLSEDIVMEFFNLANRWYRTFDESWKPEHDTIRKWIGKCTATSWHLQRGKVIQWNGALPSGAFGTNDIDSMANLLILASFARQQNVYPSEFQDQVRFVFHGDDNIYSVSPTLKEAFHPKRLRDFGADHYMTYTPATKDESAFEFKSVTECQFLKRRFHQYERSNVYMAPLEMDSITEMVMWTHPVPGHNPWDILRQVVENAVMELTIHPEGEENLRRLIEACDKINLRVPQPSLNELFRRFYCGYSLRRDLARFIPDLVMLPHEAQEDPGLRDSDNFEPDMITTKSENQEETRGVAQAGETTTTKPTLDSVRKTVATREIGPGAKLGGIEGTTAAINALIKEMEKDPTKFADRINQEAVRQSKSDTDTAPGMADVPEIPNDSNDMRVEVTNFIDQVTPIVGVDPGMSHAKAWTAFTHDDHHHSIERILSRPVPIENINWSQLSPPETVLANYDLPDLVFSNAAINAKLRNFAYSRFNVVIRIAPNAMQFQAGRLLISFDPVRFARGTKAENQSLQYLTALKHVEVNPNQHRPAILIIPYTATASMFDLKSNPLMMGRVRVSVLNQLKGDPANVESVSLSVSWWLTDVEVCVPTPETVPTRALRSTETSVYRQLETVAEAQVGSEAHTAKQKGVLSNTLFSVGEVAGFASNFPMLAHIATPVSWLANAGGHIARYFGYNKPSGYKAPRPVYPAAGLVTAHMDGVSTAIALASAEDAALPTYPDLFSTKFDEMDIGYITSRPTFLDSVTWSTSQPANSKILTIPVTPCLASRDAETSAWQYDMTPSAFVASMFKYWSGSIRYRIELVSTSFHAGRIQIIYMPRYRPTAVAPTDESGHAWSIIADISEVNEVSFEVPYLSAYPAMPCVVDNLNLDYLREQFASSTDDPYVSFLNGAIEVWVLSPLVRPAQVAPEIDINIWISCGDDMEFMIPNVGAYMAGHQVATEGNYIAAGTGFPVPAASVTMAEAQSNYYSGLASGSAQEAEGFDRGAEEQLVPMKTQKCDAAPLVAGERIKSLRQVIKRLGLLSRNVIAANECVAIDPSFCRSVNLTHTGSEVLTNHSATGSVYYGQSPLAYVSNMYAGFRGSRRYMVHTTGTLPNVTVGNITHTGRLPFPPTNTNQTDPVDRSGASNITNATGKGGISTNGAFLQLSSEDTHMLEFDVPQNARIPWQVNSGRSIQKNPIAIERPAIFINNSYQTAATYDIFEGAADDFTFGLLVGAPKVRRVGYSFDINLGGGNVTV